jgi:hypothetical protein
MAKRHQLNYNSDELALHLKQSTGQGMDALFSPPSPPPPATRQQGREQKEPSESIQVRKRARTHAYRQPKPGSSRTKPTRSRTDASVHARLVKELKERSLDRRHLSSFTFRFRAQELEALDRVTGEVNRGTHQKISKNDIVRLGLNWLLEDFDQNKRTSTLARVLTRI